MRRALHLRGYVSRQFFTRVLNQQMGAYIYTRLNNYLPPSTSCLSTTKLGYQFKGQLGECFFNEVSTYISLTDTVLLIRASSSKYRENLKTLPYYTKKKALTIEALYIKINKPSLNKINFEYSSLILKCL